MNNPRIARIFANPKSVSRKFVKLADGFLILLIRVWRLVVSPAQTFLFGANAGCRFTPTCSAFALEAVANHGALGGSWLTTKRICRCHPWGGHGHDPVPPAELATNPQLSTFHGS